jgi:hypothetical protein
MIVRNICSRSNEMSAHHRAKSPLTISEMCRRSRKIISGLKEGLTEEERYAVADHTVAQLKERGDPWRIE